MQHTERISVPYGTQNRLAEKYGISKRTLHNYLIFRVNHAKAREVQRAAIKDFGGSYIGFNNL